MAVCSREAAAFFPRPQFPHPYNQLSCTGHQVVTRPKPTLQSSLMRTPGWAPPTRDSNVTSGARAGPAGWGVRVCFARAASRGSCRRDPRSARRRAGECPRAHVCAEGARDRDWSGRDSRKWARGAGDPRKWGHPGRGRRPEVGALGRCQRLGGLWGSERDGFLPPVVVDERECSREREMTPGGEDVRLCILSVTSFPRLTATAEPLGIQQEAAGGR